MTVEIDKKGTGRHTDVSPFPIKQKEKRMKIRMKSTQKSAVDGIHLQEYGKGRQYDIPEGVARRFIRKDWAVAVGKAPVPEKKVEEKLETKVIEPPEIKDEKLEEPKDEAPLKILDGSTSQGGESSDPEPSKTGDGLVIPKEEAPPELEPIPSTGKKDKNKK